jgi:hypothetical protein
MNPAAQGQRAALAEADRLDTLAVQPFRDLVDAMHLDAQLSRQSGRVRGMVAMGMGQQDMGGPRDRIILTPRREHRVAGEPGVDEEDGLFDLDAKAGMAKPGDLHCGLPSAMSERQSISQ